MSHAPSLVGSASRQRPGEERPRSARRPTRAQLILPVGAFFLVVFVYPVAMMMLKSVTDVPAGAGPLANFAWFLGDETNMRIFAKTLASAAWVTVCCVLVAYPMAYAMFVANGSWRLA